MPYQLSPSQEENLLFFRLDGEAAERYGAIGHLRADFGRDGQGFWTTWFDNQVHLKTPAFKKEFDSVINSLRDDGPEPPFASRRCLEKFCATTPGKELTTRGGGYSIRTGDFSYYFRCTPRPNDYDILCFIYDNRYLLPELAGQHCLPGYCFSVLPSPGEMIRITRGESGYYPCHCAGMTPEAIRFKVNDENGLRQITRAQEEATLAGSLYGWNTPAAKPWNYNQDGSPRPLNQPKKNEPER